MIRDLIHLNTETPGAARTVVWDATGREISCVELTGNGKPVDLRESVALGAAFPIAHMIDGVDIFFDGTSPDNMELRPEVFDGEKWVPVQAGLKRHADGERLSLQFSALATNKIRVQHGSIPRVR